MMGLRVSHLLVFAALLLVGSAQIIPSNYPVYNLCDPTRSNIVEVNPDSKSFFIQSPNYNMGDYPKNANCSLVLQSGPEPILITLIFYKFRLINDNNCDTGSLCVHGVKYCDNFVAGSSKNHILPKNSRSTIFWNTGSDLGTNTFQINVNMREVHMSDTIVEPRQTGDTYRSVFYVNVTYTPWMPYIDLCSTTPPQAYTVCDNDASNVLKLSAHSPPLRINNQNYSTAVYPLEEYCTLVLKSGPDPLMLTFYFRKFQANDRFHCSFEYLCLHGVKFCGKWMNGHLVAFILPENSQSTLVFKIDRSLGRMPYEILMATELANNSAMVKEPRGLGSRVDSLSFVNVTYSRGMPYTDTCTDVTIVYEICQTHNRTVNIGASRRQFIVRSPNWKRKNYGNNRSCILDLTSGTEPLVLTLNYRNFFVESSDGCRQDFLCVNRVKLCGRWRTSRVFTHILPANRTFTFMFHTDDRSARSGFEILVTPRRAVNNEIVSEVTKYNPQTEALEFENVTYHPGIDYHNECSLSRHTSTTTGRLTKPTEQSIKPTEIIATPTEQTGNVQPSFLRIVWNYPDKTCQVNKIDLELSKYGIITNHARSFVGNEVATLYAPERYASGKWPDFEKHNLSRPINGGIPQLANLTAHLEQLRKAIASQIPEGSTGYGVIDQELWRTVYELNFGSFTVFRKASRAEAGRKHGTNDIKERERLAEEEWNKSAREFMERTLLEARTVRPDTHWGYYEYPRTWKKDPGTQYFNDRMAWLYNASTGIYPTIYLKNLIWPESNMKKHVESTLNEAIRVRAVHGQANTPIVAYTIVQTVDDFFNKGLLDYAIGLPAEMGIEGVIIWGSSSFFKPDSKVKCHGIKDYVRDVLGPYVSQLTERFTNCSKRRCGGRGRCVRSDYAQSTADMLKKAGLKRQTRLVSVNDNLEEMDLSHDGYELGIGASSRGNIKRFSSRSNRKQISTGNIRREELSLSNKFPGDNWYSRTNQGLHSFKAALSRAPTRQAESVNKGHSGILPSSQKSNTNPRNGFSVQYTGSSLGDKLINVYDHYLNLTHTRNYTLNLRIDQSKRPDRKATQMKVNNYQLFHNESSAGRSEMSKPRLATQADKSHWSTGGLTPGGSVKVVTADHHVSSVDPSSNESHQAGQAHDPVEVNRRASDQYDNYVCQCYSQWKGPSCEDINVV